MLQSHRTLLNDLTAGVGCSNPVPLNSTHLHFSARHLNNDVCIEVKYYNQSLGCVLISKKEKKTHNPHSHKIPPNKTHADIQTVYRKRLLFKQAFPMNLHN